MVVEKSVVQPSFIYHEYFLKIFSVFKAVAGFSNYIVHGVKFHIGAT